MCVCARNNTHSSSSIGTFHFYLAQKLQQVKKMLKNMNSNVTNIRKKKKSKSKRKSNENKKKFVLSIFFC